MGDGSQGHGRDGVRKKLVSKICCYRVVCIFLYYPLYAELFLRVKKATRLSAYIARIVVHGINPTLAIRR